jgi:hypothetical protein
LAEPQRPDRKRLDKITQPRRVVARASVAVVRDPCRDQHRISNNVEARDE